MVALLTYSSGCQITGHPLEISVSLFLESKHVLICVPERKIERLGGEVADDIDAVAPPERQDTFGLDGAIEAVVNAVVFAIETTGFDHFILKLYEILAFEIRLRVTSRET